MRLFVAIRFSEPVLARIWAIESELRRGAQAGNFTRRENLHLTLAFLGETDRAPALKQQVADTARRCAPFSLTFDRLGSFDGRGRERLCYLAADTPPELSHLVETLNAALTREGFPVEERSFRPHVTLARRCVADAVPAVRPFAAPVNAIALMRSERLGGVLTYTPLLEAPLQSR